MAIAPSGLPSKRAATAGAPATGQVEAAGPWSRWRLADDSAVDESGRPAGQPPPRRRIWRSSEIWRWRRHNAAESRTRATSSATCRAASGGQMLKRVPLWSATACRPPTSSRPACWARARVAWLRPSLAQTNPVPVPNQRRPDCGAHGAGVQQPDGDLGDGHVAGSKRCCTLSRSGEQFKACLHGRMRRNLEHQASVLDCGRVITGAHAVGVTGRCCELADWPRSAPGRGPMRPGPRPPARSPGAVRSGAGW